MISRKVSRRLVGLVILGDPHVVPTDDCAQLAL